MRKKIWTLALAIVLSLMSAGYLVLRAHRRIMAVPVHSWTQDITADCAIAITGSAGRVREGFDLLAQRSIKKLIISGVHPQVELRDIFPLLPYFSELNPADIVLERRSQTTYGNAQQSLPLVEALGCRDVVLITSRVHMPRAYQTFRAEFPPQIALYQRAVVAGSLAPSWSEESLEILKTLFYSLWAF